MNCPSCGNPNRSGAKFCDSCGTALAAAPAELASTASEPPAQERRRIGGRYSVIGTLGADSRKDVYVATDEQTGREVAVAVNQTGGVEESALARIRREMTAMERLGEHEHLVSVLDTGEDEGRPFVVSEHMPGGDVRTALSRSREGRLGVDEAIGIGIDICRALDHAHACGIIHRDLKPANVWLGPDGEARLGGFGLAATGPARVGALVGTAAYLPPEQAVGRGADSRADLYSLGAMLYEIVTGAPPFAGEDAVAIIGQHLNATPAPASSRNPAVPPSFDELLADLLAKSPSERPASAAETRRRLEAIRDEPPTQARAMESQTNPLETLAGGVFVGRRPEMRELRAAGEDALAGRGRLVLIAGEPGIGKSRICEEVATYSRMRGAKAHWGRCHEGEGAPAYWPWVQLLRSYVRDADPVALAWELGADAADVAHLVPEITERIGGLEPSDLGSDEQARFRLFAAVSRFLASASASRPLLCVLDDLHWADEPSLLLLEFLTRELGDSALLVVGTYRDVELGRHHPLARVLGEIADSDRVSRLSLHGLDAADIARYVRASTGTAASPELVEALHEQTEGNPFFVSEVVRLLASEGNLEGATAAAQVIPQGVRDVVGRRLDRLTPEANEALTVAAAIGRELDVDLLARIVDCPPETTAARLREAVAAQLLSEQPAGHFCFAHALVRETLSEELSAARRPALHGEIATVMEEMNGGGSGGEEGAVGELARHFHLAGSAGDLDKAVMYATHAGRDALDRLGYEEAAEHFERALEALALGGGDDAKRSSLHQSLAQAQLRAARLPAARKTLVIALAEAQEAAVAEDIARAALGMALTSEVGTYDEEVVAACESALGALGSGDSALRAQLLVALSERVYWVDPEGKAMALMKEATEIARRMGDEETLAHVLIRIGFPLMEPGSAQRRLAIHGEVETISRRIRNRELLLQCHAFRVRDHLELGDVTSADAQIEAYAALAEELRQPRHLWHVPLLRGMRAIMAGNLEEAETLLAEARIAGRRAGEPLVDQFCGIQAALLYRLQGRLAETIEPISALAARYPAIPAWRMAKMINGALLGDLGGARLEFERIATDDFKGVPRDIQWVTTHTMLIETAFLLGDAEHVPVLRERLAPYRGTVIVTGRAAACWGPVSRYLGLGAAATGDFGAAVTDLEESIALSRRMGDLPFQTMAELDVSRVLLRRREGDDRVRALAMLDRCLDVSQGLGMRGLIDDALALKLGAQGLTGVDALASIDEVVAAMESDRPQIRNHVAADGTVTILFSDIENSTTMTERLGDESWIGLLRSHNAIFRERLRANEGHEVKSQGDGFMLVFADPGAALRCAVEVQRELSARAAENPAEQIRVRIGMHTGTAIAEDGDFFGRNVILAARIAAEARGGEILVSEELHQRASNGEGNGFDAGRELELKGLAGRHRVYRADWEGRESTV